MVLARVIRIRVCLTALLLAAWTLPSVSAGADQEGPTKITLTPAAEPQPALRYQLFPTIIDQKPGNAAVYYGKVSAEQTHFFGNQAIWEQIVNLIDMPINEVNDKGAEMSYLLQPKGMFRFLELAANCETCDWQLQIREEPFFEILLPEIQQSRSFGRMLAARARLQIARGEFDDAIRTLQSGFALARNVSESPTIISSLVGIANSQMMINQIKTFSEQEGSPNLYWALTTLPRPLIKTRRGLQSERDAFYLTFPALRDVERLDRSEEYWREILDDVWGKLSSYLDGNRQRPRETLTLVVLRCYPLAKRALIESGMEAEVVEKMPVAQVVLMHTLRNFNSLRDEQFKWAYVPFPRAAAELQKLDAKIKAEANRRDVLPLAGVLLPAMGAVRRAATRAEREIALVRTFEAIRMHAAEHGGKLPDSLEECPVPAAIDPVTGEMFRYVRNGDTALLTGPELRGAPLSYEIRIAAP